MGPNLVSYLHGARAAVVGTMLPTTPAAAASMVRTLLLATTAVVAAVAVGGGVAAAAAVELGSGLDPPVGGGEEWHTRGLKLCPPLVLIMPGPDKGRRLREWEEEDLFAKEEKGF